MVPSLDREKEVIASWAETRGLLRLPVRVELPRNVFYPSVLSVRCVPGRPVAPQALRRRIASHQTPYQQKVCLRRDPIELKTRNATPLRAGSWSRARCCYFA
jgi:hypothetical protein